MRERSTRRWVKETAKRSDERPLRSMAESKSPEAKKLKMEPLEQAPDEDWPEAWIMPDEVSDQKKANKLDPNAPVSAADLKDIGIW